ncbi:hypothetical protein EB796_010443 [Bugula neritina]|uniref:Uncharacterized protein n=1 Tax=Bugula neritina TaxID=10212 RepID=A0A7J7JZ25_BUGNE|nr:hypothetical protein EB796_010443 [Bugula neritina]
MLSHICVECERRDLLYTPILLRQLRLLSDSCEACDEDRRLAFMSLSHSLMTLQIDRRFGLRMYACVQSFINSLSTTKDENSESTGVTKAEPYAEWTDTEEGDLMSAYAEFTDPSVDDIVTRLGEMGVSYNHSQVTSKMEQLGLISSPSCQESLDLAELVKISAPRVMTISYLGLGQHF